MDLLEIDRSPKDGGPKKSDIELAIESIANDQNGFGKKFLDAFLGDADPKSPTLRLYDGTYQEVSARVSFTLLLRTAEEDELVEGEKTGRKIIYTYSLVREFVRPTDAKTMTEVGYNRFILGVDYGKVNPNQTGWNKVWSKLHLSKVHFFPRSPLQYGAVIGYDEHLNPHVERPHIREDRLTHKITELYDKIKLPQ